MKKQLLLSLFIAALQIISFFYTLSPAYAVPDDIKQMDWSSTSNESAVDQVFGKIVVPSPVQALTAKGGSGGVSFVLNQVITLIYSVAALLFVFMVLFSALQWITSGGEKEAVGKARSRLTYALIGLVLLALAFVIFRVISQITGISLFEGALTPIPTGRQWGE